MSAQNASVLNLAHDCYHGAAECPPKCMCPCGLCDLLRTDAYMGDTIDLQAEDL